MGLAVSCTTRPPPTVTQPPLVDHEPILHWFAHLVAAPGCRRRDGSCSAPVHPTGRSKVGVTSGVARYPRSVQEIGVVDKFEKPVNQNTGTTGLN